MDKQKRKQAIYQYFVQTAQKENQKNNQISIKELLGDEGKDKRIAFVLPKSIGDLVMSTSLFQGLKEAYTDCNLYVFCEQKYFEVLEGNEYIHKLLPYSEQVDNQILLEGQGEHEGFFIASFHPYFRTQKYLDYLHNGKGVSQYDLCKNNPNKNNNSHLLSAYALSCGVKINKPQIQDTYFPLNFSKYITLHASSGMESKNYDYYTDVVGEILPYLEKNNIKIIQIGDKKDKPIPGCENFLGATNLKQTFFLIKNSMLVFGNDSFSAHVAGIYDVPLVCLYSILFSECCKPFFGSPKKQILIDSPRSGKNPSFSAQERPKTVNEIMPEKVASSVLKLLKIENSLSKLKTHFIGEDYHKTLVEIVPNFYNDKAFKGGLLNFRIDYAKNFDERSILAWSQDRKLQIFSDKKINPQILGACKKSIEEIVFYITEENRGYILENIFEIISLGIKTYVISNLSDKKTKALRLKHFDLKIETEKKSEKNLDINFKKDNLFYRSNKIILSENKLFPSKAAFDFNIIGGENGENKILQDKNFIKSLKQEHNFIKIYEHRK